MVLKLKPLQRQFLYPVAAQKELITLFYDEGLTHALTKVVPYEQGAATTLTLLAAEQILRAIPEENYDFDRAKAKVMVAIHL